MFGALEALRERPIPEAPSSDGLPHYREWGIDLTQKHSREPCVEATLWGLSGLNHYYREDAAPYYERARGSIPNLFVRRGLIPKLIRVNEQLTSVGLELFLFDSWRPAAVQHFYRNVWFPRELRARYPDWTADAIDAEAGRYWAQGPERDEDVNPSSPPPHATGAALDLTIRHKRSGEHLWMGTIFDDVSTRAHQRHLEQHARPESFSDQEALRNRRLLYWLMIEAGFWGNPNEWWHFSRGDQLWAKQQTLATGRHTRAWYGATIPRLVA